MYLPVLHVHTASRGTGAEIIWLRAAPNLDAFSALELNIHSTHRYVVVVVEDTAAIANTTEPRPFLCSLSAFYRFPFG